MMIRGLMNIFNWKYITIEVAIIVIGILIALQVGNWKEDHDTRLQELRSLRELNSELLSDLNSLTETEKRCDDVISSLRIVQLHLLNKRQYNDSLQDYAYKIIYEIHFQYRSSAFNSLRTIGVDLISNDSLKHLLVELYDYSYPRNTKLIDSEANREKYFDYFDNNRILEYHLKADNQELKIDEIINPEVFKDSKFLDLVTTKMGSFINAKRRLKKLHEEVELLTQRIAKEINYE